MKTNQEKLEAQVGTICQDLFARKESPASAERKLMKLFAFPALPPLKWEDTRTFQTTKCPLTSDSYSIWGSPEGWGCQMIPVKAITINVLGENLEHPDAIAAIEKHRNDNLKKKLL